MRTPSGTLHVVDFKKSQIVSAIQPKDYWDDKRHWEIKNNIDTLEFRVFENTDHAATLVQQNLVLKEVRGGRIVPYVITEVEKDSDDKSLVVYASGEWIQLAKAEIIEPQKIESKTLKQCMEIALKGTKWEIGKTEHDGSHSITIDEFTNPLDLLKKIAASFELEIQYRAEVVGSQIVVRYVDMVKKRGRDTRKEVTVGKDLLGIKRIENSQNICTALLGYVKKDNGEFITISEINNGVPYLVDDAAYQRWNEKGKHKFAFYTPQTENEDMSPQRLMTLMKTEMNKLVNTSVSYEVQAQSIGRLFGLAHELINEGDTIRIIDTGFTPKLYLEARAIAGDESFKDPKQDKYMFGDYREIVDQNDELRRLYQKILSSLYDKVPQELFDQLKDKVTEQNQNIIDAKDKADQAQKESQTAKDLAEATVEYMEQNLVDIIEGVKPPTANLRPNKTLWRDISGGKPGILKIWTGTTWEPVVPDTGPLQQSIKNAENEINTLKETVKDMPDKTWLNQQLEDKADKEGVYTKDWVDQNLIGKQIYETDKQGNIQKFTDMKTEIDQNAEAITHKAEKTQVDTISDDLKQVTQTANTAKQTAESNTSTITQLQTTVNNINDNVTNLMIGSGDFGEAKPNSDKDNRWWLKDNNLVRISTDTFMGNTVIETQSAWQGIAYNFADLIRRKVVKEGDVLNYSIYARIKNLPPGEKRQSFYFTGDKTGTEMVTVTSEWGRSNVSFVVTAKMMAIEGWNTEDWMRVEVWEALSGDQWYQQSSPQITVGDKVYTWRPAPEDNAVIVKKTNEIKQTVDTNVATIQSVQKEQGAMQSTLNRVEQTTNSNSQTIATISQTQGKHGEIIQQNTSDITQLNNQIKSKVSETQMQDYVGKLGETNLVFNAPFTQKEIDEWGNVINEIPSLDKWGTWTADVDKGKFEPNNVLRYGGYNSVKIYCSGFTGDYSWTGLNQVVGNIDPYSEYTYRAMVFVTNKSSIDDGLYAEIKAWNGDRIVGAVGANINDVIENGVWKEYFVTIPPLNQAVTHMQITVGIRRNGSIYISNPMFQKGSTKSVFMPNPKDMGNYDAMIREIAKKVATSDFNNKVTQMETTINQQSNRIDLKAEAEEVYTKTEANGQFGSKAIVESHSSSISLMADAINQRVEKGNIASTINQTAQSVLIQANKIYLDGYIEAKHLKAQTLQGVTIQTAPQGSGANHIRLNAQNMTLYGSGQARGYFGFINRSDSNIQSALILGNDYASSGTLNGSLVIDQTTINGSQWTNSVASIGVATGRSGNDILKSSYINFYRYDGAMQINSVGDMSLTNTNGNISLTASSTSGTTGFITLSASKDIYFTAKRGYFNFYTSDNKSFPAMTIKDLAPTTQGDVDFTFANQIMFRMARHPDYVGDGLQIKSATGDAFRDIKLRTLRATENISATGRMWAQEFIPNSSRTLKTDIEDLPFSALDKINSVNIKQYHFIRDVERFESGESITLPINYGMIAEDSDDVFTTPQKDAIKLYSSVAISIQAIQEVDFKVKNIQFDHGMLKQEVDTLKEQLEAEKLEKVSMKAEIDELKVLVQQLLNK